MNKQLEKDCLLVKNFLKNNETDLINYVLSKTKEERRAIKLAYLSVSDISLKEDICQNLSSNFKEAMIEIFGTTSENDARQLYKAIKGITTDEDTVIEIICTRNNTELKEIQESFKNLYSSPLPSFLKSSLSESLSQFLLILLNIKRRDASTADPEKCQVLASKIFDVLEGVTGKIKGSEKKTDDNNNNTEIKSSDKYNISDENYFSRVFAEVSPPEMLEIAKKYEDASGGSLSDAIGRKFKGDLEKAYKTVLEYNTNPYNYLASRIKKAINRLIIDDKMLTRTILYKEGLDMPNLVNAYKALYGIELIEDIKKKTSGSYLRLLENLISKDY